MEVGGGKIQNWSSFFYRFPINNIFISSLDNLWHFKIRLLILLRKNIWYLPSISIFSHHSVTFHAILSDINLFENYPKSARKYRNFRLNLARTPCSISAFVTFIRLHQTFLEILCRLVYCQRFELSFQIMSGWSNLKSWCNLSSNIAEIPKTRPDKNLSIATLVYM